MRYIMLSKPVVIINQPSKKLIIYRQDVEIQKIRFCGKSTGVSVDANTVLLITRVKLSDIKSFFIALSLKLKISLVINFFHHLNLLFFHRT